MKLLRGIFASVCPLSLRWRVATMSLRWPVHRIWKAIKTAKKQGNWEHLKDDKTRLPHGVLDVTPLSKLPYFDVYRQLLLDWMHIVKNIWGVYFKELILDRNNPTKPQATKTKVHRELEKKENKTADEKKRLKDMESRYEKRRQKKMNNIPTWQANVRDKCDKFKRSRDALDRSDALYKSLRGILMIYRTNAIYFTADLCCLTGPTRTLSNSKQPWGQNKDSIHGARSKFKCHDWQVRA